MFDVIVVGGGPVGSYAAGELAGRGHRVVVCERKNIIGEDVCCTGIIGREAFSMLPLAQMAGSAIVREARAASLFSPSGRLIRVSKEETQAYIVHRPVFDAELARWAQGKGVEYLLGGGVRSVRSGGSSVAVDVSGRAAPLEAKVVVLACGFGSPLPQKLGMGTIGDFVVGAQCEIGIDGLNEVEVYFHRPDRSGFAWLAPTFEGRALAGLLTRRNPGENLKSFLEYVRLRGKVIKNEGKISYGSIPLRPLPRTYGPRVLVVGEAAGQVKPMTGGGIYYGLIGARALVEVLDEALKKEDFSPSRLRQYEKLWRASLGRELQLGYLARRVHERFTDGQIEWLFGWLGTDGVVDSMLAAEGSAFDWHGRVLLRALRHEPFRALWHSIRGAR
ncbi:MAG: NAD(P)/FAD-dependent oxidoreductase [Dehalococcoidia bacterium]|nr:NAD(P)/FAD-dependent oxidoreductase [Dehalococcoidia bacterium]